MDGAPWDRDSYDESLPAVALPVERSFAFSIFSSPSSGGYMEKL